MTLFGGPSNEKSETGVPTSLQRPAFIATSRVELLRSTGGPCSVPAGGQDEERQTADRTVEAHLCPINVQKNTSI